MFAYSKDQKNRSVVSSTTLGQGNKWDIVNLGACLYLNVKAVFMFTFNEYYVCMYI